jgi:hypothetical protein
MAAWALRTVLRLWHCAGAPPVLLQDIGEPLKIAGQAEMVNRR